MYELSGASGALYPNEEKEPLRHGSSAYCRTSRRIPGRPSPTRIRSCLSPRQHPAIRQRLRHVDLLHRAAAFEVGQRARYAQPAVEAAGAQAEALDRLGDELAAGFVE